MKKHNAVWQGYGPQQVMREREEPCNSSFITTESTHSLPLYHTPEFTFSLLYLFLTLIKDGLIIIFYTSGDEEFP